MSTQPEHHGICSILGEHCAKSIEEVEKCIANQWNANEIAAKKAEEELEVKREQEQQATEQAWKEKAEWAANLEEERKAIEAAKKELTVKRQLLKDWQKAGVELEEEEEEDDRGSNSSGSAMDQQMVSKYFIRLLQANDIRILLRKKMKHKQDLDTRQNLPQVVHEKVCNHCK